MTFCTAMSEIVSSLRSVRLTFVLPRSLTRAERRTIVDIRRFAKRRIGSRDVVMVARENHRTLQTTGSHRVVEGQSDFQSTDAVRIENSRLRTDDQTRSFRFFDPLKIVFVLFANVLRN